jgi:hypothetical protein
LDEGLSLKDPEIAKLGIDCAQIFQLNKDMETTQTPNTAAKITLTKGDGRYNIAVDGIQAAWTYKNSNGTWSVRVKTSSDEILNSNNEAVIGAGTRTEALNYFAKWLQYTRPFFMAHRQAWIAKDEAEMADFNLMLNDYDAWLATR